MSRTIVILNDRASAAGGAAKVAVTSALGLARRGQKVHFVAAMGPIDQALLDAGVEVEILGQADLASGERATMASQGLWNRTAEARLASILASLRESETVVHIHSWSKALSPSVFAAVRRRNVPAVATLHDYGFVCPNAALHDFPTGQPCVLSPMSLGCLTRNCDSRSYAHKLWRIARQLSLEHLAKAQTAVRAVVCVSEFSREIYQKHLPHELRQVVVPNPIDVEDLGPAQPGAMRAFTYVGRLSREKGVLLLAEAAQKAGCPLTFVGDGELADEILTINPAAHITGWMASQDVVAWIRKARAVVLPATWRETQGMVVPEALANGVPCIASSGTAPGSAIDPGHTGALFRNGDVDDLACVLRELATDDEAIGRMGLQAYDRYWSKPATLDRHLDALETLYDDVLLAG